jgi:SAM-dependent methyltransferase
MFSFKRSRKEEAPKAPLIVDRKDTLLQGIDKHHLGLEIGPWFNPLVPKAAGYKSMSLDVVGEDELRRRALADPFVSDDRVREIETVDFVGTAGDMAAQVDKAGLAHKFDYIISSHNFEHLPNPVKFLRDARHILNDSGRIILAIPDRRVCFDYFKPVSTTADFIEAFLEDRDKPTLKQIFAQTSLESRYDNFGEMTGSFHLGMDPKHVHAATGINELKSAFANWKHNLERDDLEYSDTHCWAFTPSSFELIINDLRVLELIDLEVESISAANGNEFYAKLSVAKADENFLADYQQKRPALLHRIHDEAAENAQASWALLRPSF